MENLRSGLGNYVHNKETEKLAPLGLNLHELGELIRRAGKEAEFIVESEYKIKIGDGGHVKKVDWVWLTPHPSKPVPIVAIEIEGPAVPLKSIENDILRFKACKAPIKLIILFQVDHDRTIKKRSPKPFKHTPKEYVAGHVAKVDHSFSVEILLDEDLMKPGGIEALQKTAIALHKRIQNPRIK